MTDLSTNPTSTKQTNHYKGYKRIINPLFAMILLFGLPYILSWYFLYSGDPIAFEQPNNNGELVSPIIPLSEYALTQTNGASLLPSDLAGNWSLVTVTSACEKSCEENLFNLRQTRKALGVNRKVIKPILILNTLSAIEPLTIDLANEFPQLAIVAPSKDAEKITRMFANLTPEIDNSVFMVDPFGNIMMFYPAGFEQKGLLKDLQRLLKVYKPDI
ncbi:hypothetical protein A9Q99_05460 [Gammaproteobacteria bacterium 45_16_T64]|nr:hypothetical protein A9Q99_05460 [Gammaproteobacteria bacterium 45_16_T64]